MPIPRLHASVFAASLPFAEAMVGRRAVNDAIFAAGIDRRALDDPPLFIPLKVQAALAEALARKVGEPCLASIVTKEMPYEQLGIYASYVLGGDTLEASIKRGIKGFKYIYQRSRVIFRIEKNEAFLGIDLGLNNHTGASDLEEAALNTLVNLVRLFAGGEWVPQRVELRKKRNGSASLLEQVYGSEVHAEASLPGIVFSVHTLGLSNPHKPDAQNATVYRELRKLVGQYPGDRFTDSTEQVIDLQLRLGDASIERVAECMNLGVRTLQRRLSAESESFQSCLNRFRLGRAKSLLAETEFTIPEIAAALGFAEPNSFRRAFRKWNGTSATVFRKCQRFDSGS